MRDILERNAAKLRELHADIHAKVARRQKSEEDRQAWLAACSEFHKSYDSLAFPGGFERAIELLKIGDLATAETAILFCEIRPYYFRSGYNRTKFIRLLKRISLPSYLADRLNRVREEIHQRKLAARDKLERDWRARFESK